MSKRSLTAFLITLFALADLELCGDPLENSSTYADSQNSGTRRA